MYIICLYDYVCTLNNKSFKLTPSLTHQVIYRFIIQQRPYYTWRAYLLLVPPLLLSMCSSFSDLITHTTEVYETDKEMPMVGEIAKATSFVHHAVAEDTT